MNLFNPDSPSNLLPYDGILVDHGRVLTADRSAAFFKTLLETIEWKNDVLVMFGKQLVTKRKVAWYGDPGCAYTYSGVMKTPLRWTTELLALKKIAENKTGSSFNCCLLNLYHTGEEGMSWHSDNERELGINPVIASLSLGAERKFMLKNKITKLTLSLILQSGSLIEMKGPTQDKWLHAMPKTKKVNTPRINLTFRKIIKP